MKIILDYDEFVALQEFARNPDKPFDIYPNIYRTGNWVAGDSRRPKVKNHQEQVILSTPNYRLFCARLIDYDEMEHLFLTDLGQEVLRQHSPWMEEDNVHDKVRLDRMQVANDSQLYLTSLHETSRT